jgi:prolyl-tRNA editing enzyme YbaK/EbsC (Cys-tRNA(Pro) deacylase)
MLIYMHTKINVEPECLRKDFGWPHPKQGGMISPFLKHCFQAMVASPLHMVPPAKCLKTLLCFETPANYSQENCLLAQVAKGLCLLCMAHAFAAAIHPTQTQRNKEKELRKKSGAPKSD